MSYGVSNERKFLLPMLFRRRARVFVKENHCLPWKLLRRLHMMGNERIAGGRSNDVHSPAHPKSEYS